MLFETGPSRRRLFRPGDPYHPKREGEDRAGPWRDSQQLPSVAGLVRVRVAPAAPSDPLVALAGRHRDLWKGVDPDEYVRQLREGFE